MATKAQIFEHIDGMFDEYEDKVFKDIEKKYEDVKVYNKEEAEQMRTYITNIIDNLYDKIGTSESMQEWSRANSV